MRDPEQTKQQSFNSTTYVQEKNTMQGKMSVLWKINPLSETILQQFGTLIQ